VDLPVAIGRRNRESVLFRKCIFSRLEPLPNALAIEIPDELERAIAHATFIRRYLADAEFAVLHGVLHAVAAGVNHSCQNIWHE
jgi:hypothetical protein